MLNESAVAFPGTSWRWLTNGNGQVVDPFDYHIFNGQGVNDPNLADSGAMYQFVGNDQTLVNGFHQVRLATATNALPQQAQLHQDPNEVQARSNDNTVGEALMNMLGISVAVARHGLNPCAGTLGAGTCLAVLARIRDTNGVWAVACIHLSSTDMQSLAAAEAAIDRLHTALTGVLPGPVAANTYRAGLRAGGGGAPRPPPRCDGSVPVYS